VSSVLVFSSQHRYESPSDLLHHFPVSIYSTSGGKMTVFSKLGTLPCLNALGKNFKKVLRHKRTKNSSEMV